jgi:hypothetical protein
MSDVKGPWEFDKSLKYPSKRKGGPLFSSDLGDVEKVARMRKAREVQAVLDDPVHAAQKARRRRTPSAVAHPAPASEFSPEEELGWTDATARFDEAAKVFGTTPNTSGPSMLDQLAKAKFERAALKATYAGDVSEPGGSQSMTAQLEAARRKAGK